MSRASKRIPCDWWCLTFLFVLVFSLCFDHRENRLARSQATSRCNRLLTLFFSLAPGPLFNTKGSPSTFLLSWSLASCSMWRAPKSCKYISRTKHQRQVRAIFGSPSSFLGWCLASSSIHLAAKSGNERLVKWHIEFKHQNSSGTI